MFSSRDASSRDVSILAQAEREIAKTPGRLALQPEELINSALLERMKFVIKYPTGKFVVIEQGASIVGHALLRPMPLQATSHVVDLTIAVHEGYQGRGLGKKLMEYLISWAKSNPKIEKIQLHVRSSNERAIALYEKMKFVEDGRKTKMIKLSSNDYLDDIYMALWVGK
jgi:ribosomal protein S18 acetylase RimI-like enzyme